ncbi:MAG: MFS transporter [Acidimicrobiales bacterium]|nr:MAG: MFS transporter [Acidimicrobiales bacterium]
MTSARIIRNYQLLAGLYTLAASLIWGVNTLFLLDAGLSIGEVFVANAVFSAGMVLFEIPTGVVADTVGRRVSYLLSIAVLGVTTVLYLLAAQAEAGVGVFAAVSLVMGLGFTFYSGALEAWLVDALHSVGMEDDLDHVFARSQQITGAAMLVGTTAGGFLGQIDLGVPFGVRAALLVALFVFSWRVMHDLGFTPRPLELSHIGTELREQTRVGITYGWQQPGLRLLMLSGVVRGSFLAWAFYSAQPYLLGLLKDDKIWVVGVITAAMSLSTIAGNQIVEWLTRRCGRRSTIILGGSIVTTVGSLVMGVTNSFWVAVPAFLLVTGSLGVISPVRQAYVHHVAPSEHRATVISFDAMLASVGGTGGQLGLGRLSGAADDLTVGLGRGYVVGGLTSVLVWPLVWAVRRRGDEADVIVGSRPRAGTCAAQGLPRDTHITSHPRDVVTTR